MGGSKGDGEMYQKAIQWWMSIVRSFQLCCMLEYFYHTMWESHVFCP
jgi:hypothetical protein